MGQTLTALILLLLASTAPVAAQNYPLVPDHDLTPGVIASTSEEEVCGIVDGLSYSKRHRETSTDTKRGVARSYGLPFHNGSLAEADHRVPLSLGGADVPQNLWEQAWEGQCGAHAKDRLEVTLWHAVCKEHAMPLSAAQQVFLGPYWKQLPGCVTAE